MPRRLRVFDETGDFEIEIPDEIPHIKVTLGYFNPASAGQNTPNQFGGRINSNKKAALRIYEGKTAKGNQLACFTGVKGFCDTRLKIEEAVEKKAPTINAPKIGEIADASDMVWSTASGIYLGNNG